MPDITLSGSADQLSTPDDLWEFRKELRALGWRGSIQGWEDPDGSSHELLEMRVPDAASVDGLRSIKATLGDWKILLGTTYSVMTPEAYAAAYPA